MKKEQIKDMNNMDLMRAIYKEVKETKTIVEGHTQILERHEKILEEHTEILKRHEKILEEHTTKLENLEKVQQEHTTKLENLEKVQQEHTAKLENLEKVQQEHTTKLENLEKVQQEHTMKLENLEKEQQEHTIRLRRLEEGQEFNFKKIIDHNLKIDKLIENLNVSDKVEKLHFEYVRNKFKRLEQKVDSNFKELNDKINNIRDIIIKLDNIKFKGINDYERIVLNDLESRISILEEETETYKLD